MKRLLPLILLHLTTFSAQADSPLILDGIDISPAVEYFEPMVTPLKQNVTVYNWSQTGDYGDDDSQLDLAMAQAKTFWRMYGDPKGNNNMYGYGLYTAIDPVATRSYGGNFDRDDWRILALELPQGLRLLDFPGLSLNPAPIPAPVADILNKFDCGGVQNAEALFGYGGYALKPSCQKLVRRIFADVLRIDAFAYGYAETNYRICSAGMINGYRAFVITAPDWMTTKNVRFYTSKSTKNLEERTRIQTLFLKATEALKNTSSPEVNVRRPIADFLIANPDYDLERSLTKCSGDQCVITATFCDGKKTCRDLDLPALPRPGGALITSAEAAKSLHGQPTLLWKDLEGQPKTPTLSTWMKKNQFGCDGTLPYETK